MIFGTHDEGTLAQFNDVKSRAVAGALMADGHLGYVMPIGGVVGYDNQVSPIGVGVDIACGNCAIKTDLDESDLAPKMADREGQLGDLANEIVRNITFGAGGKNMSWDAPKDHPIFEDPRWGVVPRKQQGNLIDKARAQLGTTGGGNHYVDVFTDEEGYVWVGVHFGSRRMGFDLAHSFVALAQGLEWGDKPNMNEEVLLDLDTPLGQDYWSAMELAGEYAHIGREWVARKTADILGGTEVDMVHNHHNFAWKEDHQGQEMVVVRKGATPAAPGQRGFVGGSMGDQSVILKGTEYDDGSLQSTVHGAGRVLGRAAAKKGKFLGPGLGRDESTIITPEAMDEWVRGKGVILRGGDVDEAPQAYRRLPDVLEAQGRTIEVLHTLDPIIVCMAPAKGRR